MFNFILVNPLTNLVLAFYHLLGENLGLAIILFTICLRIVLLPLTVRQVKLQRKMAELQPKLQELQAKRKNANQMSPEELAIMRQTTSSCLGGCVPLLIQIPILLSLNGIISKISTATSGDIFNSQLYFDSLKHSADYQFNTSFLGLDLAQATSKIGFSAEIIPYSILIILLVGTQYITGRLMTSFQNQRKEKLKNANAKKKANQPKLTEKELEKQKLMEDQQKIMQNMTLYFFPAMIGFTGYSLGAALPLYWLVQNIFAIGQTSLQNKMIDENHDTLGDFIKGRRQKSKEAKYRKVEFEDVKEEESEIAKPSTKKKASKPKATKKHKKKK